MTKTEQNEKIFDIIEDEGWKVTSDGEYVELENYSPAGENLIIDLPTENFLSELGDYVDNYDPDEHVKLWAEHAGENGTPSISVLVKDAKEIGKMLRRLWNAVREIPDREPVRFDYSPQNIMWSLVSYLGLFHLELAHIGAEEINRAVKALELMENSTDQETSDLYAILAHFAKAHEEQTIREIRKFATH